MGIQTLKKRVINNVRRILYTFLLVICVLVMTSCEVGSNKETAAVEDTIRGYVAAFNDEDFDKCLTYFTDYEDREDALAFLSFMRDLSGPLELKKIGDTTIVPVAVPGDRRTATASVTFSLAGEDNTDLMQLKEVEGYWKIVWEHASTPVATPPPAIQ